MTRTTERLTYLLLNDPGYIADFIIRNNPNAVADRIADVLGNRPVGMESIQRSLQVLLDAQRQNDFVHVLSVPMSLELMSPEQAAQVYRAVGLNTPPDELGHQLAMNALRAWQDDPTTAAPHEQPAPVRQAVQREATPSAEEKRRTTIRYAVIGCLVLLTIVSIAIGVRALRR